MTALGPTAHDKGPLGPNPRTSDQSWVTDELLDLKGDQRISVVFPARNEAATIGPIVAATAAGPAARLIDEVVVIDDQSTDTTARVAADAGAIVHSTESVLASFGPTAGKGSALWRSLAVTTGDLVAWCDADITNFDERFVAGPVAALLRQPEAALSKAFYRRPLNTVGDGGGRVTELLARPLLAMLRPELVRLRQPLSGEYAGRRSVLEAIPFWSGYSVDLALLLEVADFAGPQSIVSVDLGVRHHRNRTLDELGPQAAEILQMALIRAGNRPRNPAHLPTADGAAEVAVYRYPPMISVRGAN